MNNRRATPATLYPDSSLVQPPQGPELGDPGLLQSLSGILHQHRAQTEGEVNQNKPSSSAQINLRADLKIEQAMAYVLAHTNFSYTFLGKERSADISQEPSWNFKAVDSLERLNILADKSESLWRLEVERLVTGINNADANVLFPENGMPDGDYSLLMSIAEDLMLLVATCRMLNEITVMEEVSDMHSEDAFQKAFDHLRRLKGSVDDRKAKCQPENTRGTYQRLSKEKRRESMFALIDHITLVLGRILILSAPNHSTWCYSCLSSLAKYTTKLKVLTKDPIASAATALSTAEDAIMAKRSLSNDPKDKRLGRAVGTPGRQNQRNTDNNAEDTLRRLYYGHNLSIRENLEQFIGFVVGSLVGVTLAGTPRTTFEICSVVYETGLERFRTWVYQERDGDLQATACQQTIPMARPAFQLLQVTATALQAGQTLRSRPPPRTANDPSLSEWTRQPLKTHFHWNDISSDSSGSSGLANGYSPEYSVDIRTLAEAVSVMVPLLFVSPSVLTDLPDLFRTVTTIGEMYKPNEAPGPLAEHGKFKAFFSLFTDGQIDVNKRIRPMDASSLSKGLMTRDRLLLGRKIGEIYGKSFSPVDDQKSRLRQAALAQEMDRRNQEMNNWIFEEDAVLVSCKFYVWTTMGFAALLAICGVVVGFTVRGRIEAVDPFNITTYCWVLAAFGILVAKSIRVETWPWRDFLHGHVRCRSVTELHSVTRIPEEFILCRLLDAEETSILDTRGPYNSAFERKHDGGFSIDRPLTMWTMLLSGLIMVKVNTDLGPTLVCLDVRRGTKYVTVGHSDSKNSRKKEREQIVCTNLNRSDSLLPLKRQAVDWNRVVGLYNNEKARFV